MRQQSPELQPTSPASTCDSHAPDREPFVPPAVTELGRMNDLTLLGGSL